MEVLAAKGRSLTRSLAFSLVPSTASRPPSTRMVVEAQNEGLAARFCVMAASTMRWSRKVTWYIHSLR